MIGLLNGAVGYWDELAIALVALVVLWVAVKLAGRNPARDEGEEDEDEADAEEQEHNHSPHRSAKKIE
jgi:hypothetical protein